MRETHRRLALRRTEHAAVTLVLVRQGWNQLAQDPARAVIEDPLDGVVPEAGPDQLAHPGNNVLLDARASVTNAQSTFSWSQSFGTNVGLSGATGPTALITAPQQTGDLVFLLTVGGTKEKPVRIPWSSKCVRRVKTLVRKAN